MGRAQNSQNAGKHGSSRRLTHGNADFGFYRLRACLIDYPAARARILGERDPRRVTQINAQKRRYLHFFLLQPGRQAERGLLSAACRKPSIIRT
jgi:hypothetical protein